MLKTLCCLPLLLMTLQSIAEPIDLDRNDFEHIHFRRIQPTTVTFEAGAIRFDVNKSSSFLLLPFEDIKVIRKIAFEWKADGMLNKHSAAQEKTRKGDDAWLRIGLVISGQPESIPEALLPRWLQRVRNALEHPSNSMIYLIPDARHAPGETWQSPYNASIRMIAVASRPLDDDWNQVAHELANPKQTVGLWIMADGDNTASIFSSQLRNLVVE